MALYPKNKIEYYVGILPENRSEFEDFFENLNSQGEWDLDCKIISEFDDPNGYYTFHISGRWPSYFEFSNNARSGGFVKSLYHYEE